MDTMKLTRTLTAQERKTLELLNVFEELADKKRLYGAFTVTEDALQLCEVAGIAQPLRVERDRSTNLFHVWFMLPELHKYVNFICNHVGFTVRIDGSIVTKDGMRIERK